jgi:hypothetical protein
LKKVYTIVDREGKDSIWIEVGIAFDNKDGSMNVHLNALPVNGKLHIREPKEKPQGDQPERKQKPRPAEPQVGDDDIPF